MKGKEAEGEQRSSNWDQFVGCFGKFSALPGNKQFGQTVETSMRLSLAGIADYYQAAFPRPTEQYQYEYQYQQQQLQLQLLKKLQQKVASKRNTIEGDSGDIADTDSVASPNNSNNFSERSNSNNNNEQKAQQLRFYFLYCSKKLQPN
ncbi:hypothetical protein ACLKA6_015966 [Drosophila palustris]